MKIIVEIDDRSNNGDTITIDFIRSLKGWLINREDVLGLVESSVNENGVVFSFTVKKQKYQ